MYIQYNIYKISLLIFVIIRLIIEIPFNFKLSSYIFDYFNILMKQMSTKQQAMWLNTHGSPSKFLKLHMRKSIASYLSLVV